MDKGKREESKMISIIQHCTGDHSQCSKVRKIKNKKHLDRKEEISLCLLACLHRKFQRIYTKVTGTHT